MLTPVNELQLPHGEITLAELLKPLGYASAFIGKWHLGGEGHLPVDQGFDENSGAGITASRLRTSTVRGTPAVAYGIPTLAPRQAGET